MIIEFVGLPGSGKTTLYRKLLERLRTTGRLVDTTHSCADTERSERPGYHVGSDIVTATSPSQSVKAFLYLRVAWVYKKAVLLAAKQLFLRRRPSGRRWFRFRLLIVSLRRSHEARKLSSNGQLRLLDEGPIQRAFTVFVDGVREIDVEAALRYAKVAPAPDLLVYTRMGADVVLRRLAQRERGLSARLGREGHGRAARVLAEAEQMLDRVTSELEQQGVALIRVGPCETERAERQVVDCVLSSRADKRCDPRQTGVAFAHPG